MKISVIMPIYNETINELKMSIHSILNQTLKDFEFIIVDDNPRSKEIRQYLYKVSSIDSRIRLIFNSTNKGSVISANEALAISRGKYVARMDSDDISRNNRLEKELEFLTKYNLDIVCCNYVNMNNNKIYNTPAYCTTTQINQKKIRHTMSFVNIAIGPTLFFKRCIISRIGLYRNILVEDYDLAVRSLIFGYKLGYLSIPLLYKRYRLHSLSTLNTIKEFIILKAISKYTRCHNFNKVIPIKLIYSKLDLLKYKDIKYYRKFLNEKNKLNKNKSFKHFVMKYYYLLLSPLSLKGKIFFHFYKMIQNILMK